MKKPTLAYREFLITRMKRGESNAYYELMAYYRPLLFRSNKLLLNGCMLAREISIDVFAEVWRARAQFTSEASLRWFINNTSDQLLAAFFDCVVRELGRTLVIDHIPKRIRRTSHRLPFYKDGYDSTRKVDQPILDRFRLQVGFDLKKCGGATKNLAARGGVEVFRMIMVNFRLYIAAWRGTFSFMQSGRSED